MKQSKPIDEIVAAIHALDLEAIKFKLMDAEEGEGWSRETVDRLEVEYKRFLILLVKYPDAVVAPSKDVDAFWHGHILDTMKYAEDCERVFGYFLHHFPYFGMRGAADAAALAAAAQTMQQLSDKEFGVGSQATAAFCYAAKPSNAAFCYAAKPVEAAFCYAAKPLAAAFCYAAKPADAAFCYAAKPVAAAFCYAAKPVEAAFCYAAKPVAAAFCYAAKPERLTPQTFDFSRPGLSLAA
jgi:hypothetical protein